MTEFNTTLLREKFEIHDAMPDSKETAGPIVALSNRLTLPLAKDADQTENYVVRAQNMHTAIRIGAYMARDFYDNGPLLSRSQTFDWQAAYESVTKGYEQKWNPRRWVAIYNKGRVVFEAGEEKRHAFLDIIEQCDARNPGDYEKAMEIAKDAFQQAGRLVNIKHDANVALVMHVTETEGKCGIILRGPNRTTTFNFTARRKAGRDVKVSQCLTVSAAFLEGIQLAFMIGMTNQKLRYDLIAETSEEALKAKDASQKMGRLNTAVAQFENIVDMAYRPDRPNFGNMVDEAEEFGRKVFADEIRLKMQKGETSDWIE